MRILLTNDDGIHAPGLASLEKIARALSDDVWICTAIITQSVGVPSTCLLYTSQSPRDS